MWIKPEWPVTKNIHAAVTLRKGGFSCNAFSSLNLASHVNDKPISVQKNRKLISQMLNLPTEPIWLEQVHGNRVIKAKQTQQPIQADASYSDEAGIVCAILTADCLPVLLASTNGTKIAAIHAGWKGLLAGIISNTIHAIGSAQVIAWLGPAIGANCFEVGHEVKDAFISKSKIFSPAFCKKKDDTKYLANIYQLAMIELSSMGVTKMYGGNYCTVTDKENFYSFRRDGETGRMATLIWRD